VFINETKDVHFELFGRITGQANVFMETIKNTIHRLKDKIKGNFYFFTGNLNDGIDYPDYILEYIKKHIIFLGCFSKKGRDDVEILIPDYYLLTDGFKNDYIKTYLSYIPFYDRIPIAKFRGSQTGGLYNMEEVKKMTNPRLKAVHMSLKNPELLDIRFINSYNIQNTGGEEYIQYMTNTFGPVNRYEPMENFNKNRYLLCFDGNHATPLARPETIMCSGSVPIFQTNYIKYWSAFLKEDENCVRIKDDLSDLLETVQFLNKNPTLSENIATNARKLAEEVMAPEFWLEYITYIFNTLHFKINENNFLVKNNYKTNKNAYFLCHGGIGDMFHNCGAIRFASYFYNKIMLFCPSSSIKNLQILFNDINIEFIPYGKWYSTTNTDNTWPSVTDDWYNCTSKILSQLTVLGYPPKIMFDWETYIDNHADLSYITNKEDAWHHWINFGIKENRTLYDKYQYILFDWETYISRYSDLSHIKNKEDAWHHWINFGMNEGRKLYMQSHEIDIDADILINGDIFTKYIDRTVSYESRYKHNFFKCFQKITHPYLIDYCNYLPDIQDNHPWEIVTQFYKDLNFKMYIYYHFFNIPSTNKSIELYESIKHYKIVFLHFTSSCGETNIPYNEWAHIHNDEYLIINPDKNHYDINNSPVKHLIAEKFLNLLIVDYIDILLNATDIYTIDSSFGSLLYPLRATNKLKATNFIIYDRYYPTSTINTLKPINLSGINYQK
jgi:hypothetical protein